MNKKSQETHKGLPADSRGPQLGQAFPALPAPRVPSGVRTIAVHWAGPLVPEVSNVPDRADEEGPSGAPRFKNMLQTQYGALQLKRKPPLSCLLKKIISLR